MYLTGQQIIDLGIIENPRPKFKTTARVLNTFRDGEKDYWFELSGGQEASAYGLTLAQDIEIAPKQFMLASTAERLCLPSQVELPIIGLTSIIGTTVNKSTLARIGLIQPNTDMESGWDGHLTLELFNASNYTIFLPIWTPIATARFACTLGVVEPYAGKYQNQPNRPVEAR
jgi:dCTP deaminase